MLAAYKGARLILAPLAVVSTLSLSSCATANLTLQSTPSSAEVYIRPLGTGELKQIGETPLTIKAADLLRDYGGSGPVFIELRKEGYTAARTVVTDLSASDLSIQLDLQQTSGLEEQDKLNSVIDGVFESQSLARSSRYEDALARLRALEKEAPQLAAIYEIEGGIYYIQKRYREALDAYSAAVKLNPKNPQSLKMRNFLEASLGFVSTRAPASPPKLDTPKGSAK